MHWLRGNLWSPRVSALWLLGVTALSQLWVTSPVSSCAVWLLTGVLYAAAVPPLLPQVAQSAPHRRHMLMMTLQVFPAMELTECWGVLVPDTPYQRWAEGLCLLLFLYRLVQFARQELCRLEWQAGTIGLSGDSFMISTAGVMVCVLISYHPLTLLWQQHGWYPLLYLAYLTSGLYMAIGAVMMLALNRYPLHSREVLLVCIAVLTFSFFLMRFLLSIGGLSHPISWDALSHVVISGAGSCVLVYAGMPSSPISAYEAAPVSRITHTNWIGAALLICALPLAGLISWFANAQHMAPVWLWIVAGAVCTAAGVTRLLPLLRQALFWQHQYRRMALHDNLTDLPNRWALVTLEKQWRRQFGSSRDLVVFCIDLDDFKSINDLYGHHVGDLLLCAVARELLAVQADWQTLGHTPIHLTRMGGDEFVLLMLTPQGQLPRAQAVEMARALHQRLARWWSLPAGVPVFCKVSLGVEVQPLSEWDAAFRHADHYMYQAKSSHCAPLDTLLPSVVPQNWPRQQIREWTHKALSQPLIPLELQAIVCARTLQIQGYEVLARLAHPEHAEQQLYPAAFLNVVDSDNLHELLCTRVIQSLAAHRSALQACALSINIIPSLIATLSDSQKLHSLILTHGLEPKHLTLEILEASAATCGDLTASMTWLREQGYSLAMDDFGVGYSNLHRLVQWPFDQLKIDRSVIDAASEGDPSVLASIRSLALSRGMKLVAEGVSNARQLATVQHVGIDFMQGFLHSRPQPIGRIVAYLNDKSGADTQDFAFSVR